MQKAIDETVAELHAELDGMAPSHTKDLFVRFLDLFEDMHERIGPMNVRIARALGEQTDG